MSAKCSHLAFSIQRNTAKPITHRQNTVANNIHVNKATKPTAYRQNTATYNIHVK